MAKKIKIGDNLEVEGLEELESMFQQLPVSVQKESLSPAIKTGADALTEEVRRRAPVAAKGSKHSHDEKYGHRPGFLRDSITTKHFTKLNGMVMSIVGYGQDAFYGYMLEKGTSKMKPKRFMKPAFDSKASGLEVQIAEIAKEGIARSLEDAKSKAGVVDNVG